MKTSQTDILILPGLGGGGPDYWYERWSAKLKTARRIEQPDWDNPDRSVWLGNIEKKIFEAERPVILIGHSLGVIAAVHAATSLPKSVTSKVMGGYFVAPPDMARAPETLPEIAVFAPVPEDPLPFPSVLVASRDDPYCSHEKAEDYSYAWGARFESAGESGHINADSGQGPWPEGLLSFAQFMSTLGPSDA
ncbi:MAG: alpha/beta fold hydrolase [Pseudomonadota bacterium]